MKGRLSKVSLLFLALVLALSGVGAAFAAWTDSVTISGTVTTGNVDLLIYGYGVLDQSCPGDMAGDPADWNYYSGTPDYHTNEYFQGGHWLDPDGKNVACAEVTLVDLDTLKVDLWNVYPSYYNNIQIYPRNAGSVPVRIVGAIISWNGNEHLFLKGDTYLRLDLSGNGVDDLEMSYGDAFGWQLHEDDQFGTEPEISFRLHVLQDEGEGVQGQSFSFTIQIVAVQWNEYGIYSLGEFQP